MREPRGIWKPAPSLHYCSFMANPISRYYLKRKGEREKKNSNIRVLKKSYREVSYIRICFKIGKKKKKKGKTYPLSSTI